MGKVVQGTNQSKQMTVIKPIKKNEKSTIFKNVFDAQMMTSGNMVDE